MITLLTLTLLTLGGCASDVSSQPAPEAKVAKGKGKGKGKRRGAKHKGRGKAKHGRKGLNGSLALSRFEPFNPKGGSESPSMCRWLHVDLRNTQTPIATFPHACPPRPEVAWHPSEERALVQVGLQAPELWGVDRTGAKRITLPVRGELDDFGFNAAGVPYAVTHEPDADRSDDGAAFVFQGNRYEVPKGPGKPALSHTWTLHSTGSWTHESAAGVRIGPRAKAASEPAEASAPARKRGARTRDQWARVSAGPQRVLTPTPPQTSALSAFAKGDWRLVHVNGGLVAWVDHDGHPSLPILVRGDPAPQGVPPDAKIKAKRKGKGKGKGKGKSKGAWQGSAAPGTPSEWRVLDLGLSAAQDLTLQLRDSVVLITDGGRTPRLFDFRQGKLVWKSDDTVGTTLWPVLQRSGRGKAKGAKAKGAKAKGSKGAPSAPTEDAP